VVETSATANAIPMIPMNTSVNATPYLLLKMLRKKVSMESGAPASMKRLSARNGPNL
jgi:hypothetical protein